jgi:polysaccharide pyruvyl transferase WcaK-like protein
VEDVNKLTGKQPLIVGGGDIVYDELVSKVKNLKCPKHLFSVSLTSCDCINKLKSTFDTITVRDVSSLEKLKQISTPAQYLPDAAFALTPNRIRGHKLIAKLFKEDEHELYRQTIIVTFNAYLGPQEGKYTRDSVTFMKAVHDLAHIADHTPASFIFLPFSTSAGCDDRVTGGFISSLCKYWRKNLVVYKPLDPQDVLDIHIAADAVVSTRLHGSIFSTIAGTPFVDLTHHNKNGDYLKTNGLFDWSVDYWSLNRTIVKNLINSHLTDTKARSRLMKITNANKKLITEFTNNWKY